MFTLDQLYSKTIHEFESKDQKQIKLYNKKKLEYEESKKETTDELKIQMYEAKIDKLNKKIKKHENNINSYLLENSNDLFHYFEIKKNIEHNNNPKKLIHHFFDKTKKNEIMNNKEYNHCIEKYMKKNNFDIYNKEYLNPDDDYQICNKCNKGEMIQSTSDGILICNHCHIFLKYLIHNDKPTYKEPPKEISFYAYRRINHFKEILAQFQAKETTEIPTRDY